MTVEASRDPERMKHVWVLPKGMTRAEALHFFLTHTKPRTYEFEHFTYHSYSGHAETI